MSAAGSAARPLIVIKRAKGGGGHGHHGGAWKVAYADFVTAMMSFFLLLWLLNVTTHEQRQGVADYFDPANITRAESGAGGVLGGRTVSTPGRETSPHAPASPDDPELGLSEPGGETAVPDSGHSQTPPSTDERMPAPGYTRDELEALYEAGQIRGDQLAAGLARLTDGDRPADPTPEQLARSLAAREEAMFAAAEQELQRAIVSIPDLRPLADNLLIDRTAEGLRIQIVDQERQSMFESGSAAPNPRTEALMALVAQVVFQMPNDVAISGHTDTRPFSASSYDNWNLSTDRANATRRVLISGGLPEDRVARVVGKADTEPLIANDGDDPRNRRISITLLSQVPDTASGPTDG